MATGEGMKRAREGEGWKDKEGWRERGREKRESESVRATVKTLVAKYVSFVRPRLDLLAPSLCS